MGLCSSVSKKDLLEQVVELETKATSVETTLDTTRTERDDLRQALVKATADTARLVAVIAEKDADLASAMAAVAAERKGSFSAQGKASAHAAAAQALRGELEQAVSKHGQQAARIEELEGKLATLSQSRDRFLRRLRNLRNKATRVDYVQAQAERFCEPEDVARCSRFGQHLIKETFRGNMRPRSKSTLQTPNPPGESGTPSTPTRPQNTPSVPVGMCAQASLSRTLHHSRQLRRRRTSKQDNTPPTNSPWLTWFNENI